MKFTLIAAATLATTVTAFPLAGSCEGPYGELPCGSRDAQNYTVKAGDTMLNIAGKFMSGACDIGKYNNISNINLIFPGQNLVIPANCAPGKGDNSTCIPDSVKATGTQDCVKGLSVTPPQYEVIPKDTFTLIANRFDLKLNVLEAANTGRFASFDAIFPGNKTNIPICNGCSCTNQAYTVKSGDTFDAIARARGILVGQVMAANPGQIPENLQIGQVINVPLCQCVA